MWLERPVFSSASVQPVHSGLVPSNHRSSDVSSRGRWSKLIQEFEATVTGLLLFFSHATKSIICHLRPIKAHHAHCFCTLLTIHIIRTRSAFFSHSWLFLDVCKVLTRILIVIFLHLTFHLHCHCQIICQKEA